MGINPMPLFLRGLAVLLEALPAVDVPLALRLELAPVLLRFVTPPEALLLGYFFPLEYRLLAPLPLLDDLGLLCVCVLPRFWSLL